MKTGRMFGVAAAGLLLAGLGVGLSGTTAPAAAQLGGLGGLGGRLLKKAPVGGLLAGKPPITTSLEDAQWGDPESDRFTPREARRSLLTLERTANAGFVLQPGFYELDAQSYCLKAGTHGPGGGDGYLYAPPKGPAEDAVMTILRNSVDRPEIPQQKIQQLLWAIIARAKFEDLAGDLKAVAAQLLTPRQLASLNRNALDTVMRVVGNDLPAPLRQIAQAEQQLRQMLTSPGASFADMERVAVLAGVAPMGAGSQEVPSGRWSRHPDGYLVRYLPSGYSRTTIHVWVQPGSPAIGREFDPATHIAVPGNTNRQRLIQSGRASTA